MRFAFGTIIGMFSVFILALYYTTVMAPGSYIKIQKVLEQKVITNAGLRREKLLERFVPQIRRDKRLLRRRREGVRVGLVKVQ